MTGWKHEPICSLGEVITGSTPRTSDESFYGGETPFVTPTELGYFAPILGAARTLSNSGIKQARILPKDSVLVCCIGSLGKVGIIGCPAATNQQINSIVFHPDRILARFGFYACRLLKKQLETMAPATTVAIVSKSKFEKLLLPVPPIAEQKRIAAILDKAEELRELRRQALRELDAIAQSIFFEMFGDPIVNPKEWDIQQLNECAETIQIGPFGTQLHEKDYVDKGIPAINPTHIKNGKIVPNPSFSVSDEKYRELSQYHLKADDIILGRRGEMGRCARITATEAGWLCGTGSLFIRPKRDLLEPIYLASVLSSPSAKTYLEHQSQGVTMPNLNKSIVGQIPIPLPSLLVQKKFIQQLEAVNQLKATHQESLSRLEDLFVSLQNRAFRGEL